MSAYVNPSSIRRPAASPARATEPESAARPATASAAIAHQCVASGEVGRHECRPLAAASRGSQHFFAAPRRQSGIGAAIDTMGGSSTMPRWRSPRRQPRSDCNWAKAASISRGDNRPGVPGSQVSIAARSRRPGDHHGMSTRRAGSPGRTSHTRRWLGCPVSMGLRALRHPGSPKHSALSRSVVVDPHIASGEQYVDRLVFTSRSPQPVVAAEQLPASLCGVGAASGCAWSFSSTNHNFLRAHDPDYAMVVGAQYDTSGGPIRLEEPAIAMKALRTVVKAPGRLRMPLLRVAV